MNNEKRVNIAKQENWELTFGAANFVDNTNTATKEFKRAINGHDRIKQAIIHMIASKRVEEITKKIISY